jgi:capsule polysaccharide export protein KpsE/RkpR
MDKVPSSSERAPERVHLAPEDLGLGQEEVPREKLIAKLELCWKRRRFILRWTAVGFAFSTMIAFVIPKRFQSTARLMPPDQMNVSTQMLAAAASKAGAGLGAAASNLLGLKSTGELFVGILESRTVRDDIIHKFDLRKLYNDQLLEDARADLIKNTTISEDRKSGIITIQVMDKSPERAAAMVQEYIEELDRVVTQLNTSSAHREREFLEERLGEVKRDLESAEKGFSEFASKNTAIDIQAQSKAMIEAAATLEGESIAAQTELRGLKQIYTDNNVRVRTTQARVDELQPQLQKMGGKSGSTADTEGQDDNSLYPSIRKLPLLGVNYADLYRNTKVQEAVFETLTQEYELAKVEEAKETPSVKAIDLPDIPGKKSFPPRLLIVALGTMVAFWGALFWIDGKGRWDGTAPEDPRKALAQEVLSTFRGRLRWAAATVLAASSVAYRVRSRVHRRQDLTESSTSL